MFSMHSTFLQGLLVALAACAYVNDLTHYYNILTSRQGILSSVHTDFDIYIVHDTRCHTRAHMHYQCVSDPFIHHRLHVQGTHQDNDDLHGLWRMRFAYEGAWPWPCGLP
jgi:hypothetical protein